jgi:hypothetical protein
MLSECELIDTKNISLVEPEYEVCWRVSEANESQGVSVDEYLESCDFSRENTNIETYRCTIYWYLCSI